MYIKCVDHYEEHSFIVELLEGQTQLDLEIHLEHFKEAYADGSYYYSVEEYLEERGFKTIDTTIELEY